jgi:ATP-dependent protease HslVU (ClpYQ) peptidase subunit
VTIIIGVETPAGVIIAGDSAATSNGRVILRTGGKVLSLNSRVAVGCAGSVRMQQVIRTHLNVPRTYAARQSKVIEPEEWMLELFIPALIKAFEAGGFLQREQERINAEGTYLLVGIEGELYAVWPDLQIERSLAGYHAIGSGTEYALGAMHACDCAPITEFSGADRVIDAGLKAAAAYDSSVRKPFTRVRTTTLAESVGA